MNIRPSKITKFFPIESSNDPLRFFPSKNLKNNNHDTTHINKVSAFDNTNIALVTSYNSSNKLVYYSLYMNNLKNKSITGTIIDNQDEILGDLDAFIEVLQYIIYNPSFFDNISKQKIIIYTNSITISNIYKPFSSFISNNDYSKAYFKIQGLLKCIKNISIEYQKTNEYPCSAASVLLNEYLININ